MQTAMQGHQSSPRRCGCNKRCLFLLSFLVIVAAVFWQWYTYVDLTDYYKNKRVLITGASKGIGKGLAIHLAKLGAALVISARTESLLNETRRECLQYTDKVIAVVGDVGQEQDCAELANAAVEGLGGLDILILNAVYSPPPTFFSDLQNPSDNFFNVLNVNTMQSIRLISLLRGELERSSGVIVGVSSLSAYTGLPKFSPYVTSKHALHGFLRSLRSELIIQNSNVTMEIMPLPFVRTDKALENTNPFDKTFGLTVKDCAERMLYGIPLRRSFHFITWDGLITAHVSSLCPNCMDWIARTVLKSQFQL